MTQQAQGKLSNSKQEVEMTRSRVNESFVPIWFLVNVLLPWLVWVRKVFRNLQYTSVKKGKTALNKQIKPGMCCVNVRGFLQMFPAAESDYTQIYWGN